VTFVLSLSYLKFIYTDSLYNETVGEHIAISYLSKVKISDKWRRGSLTYLELCLQMHELLHPRLSLHPIESLMSRLIVKLKHPREAQFLDSSPRIRRRASSQGTCSPIRRLCTKYPLEPALLNLGYRHSH